MLAGGRVDAIAGLVGGTLAPVHAESASDGAALSRR
jgi:hypothetical protein